MEATGYASPASAHEPRYCKRRRTLNSLPMISHNCSSTVGCDGTGCSGTCSGPGSDGAGCSAAAGTCNGPGSDGAGCSAAAGTCSGSGSDGAGCPAATLGVELVVVELELVVMELELVVMQLEPRPWSSCHQRGWGRGRFFRTGTGSVVELELLVLGSAY